MIRAAIIFTNYGPYHVARAMALNRAERVDSTFIELTSSENKYPWHDGKAALGNRLVTLQSGTLEVCSPREVASAMVNVLTEKNPDAIAVAGYSVPAMRAAVRWARGKRKPVIMMSESTMLDFPRSWPRERLKRWWIQKNVDAAVVGGIRSREYLEHLGVPRHKIWDRYDVVDNQVFAQAASTIRANGSEERARRGLTRAFFLYVGRFSPEKNLKCLMEAHRIYSESVADPWDLVLVGGGPQEQELKSIAAKCSVSRVVFPGAKKLPELAAYYALASCFVLPSISEPWGLVVNEAMASGLPVLVSTACGCSADLLVEDVNGYRFDARDGALLAAKLKQISSLPSARLLEMSNESRRIIAQYSPDHWARNLAAAITCACQRERAIA